MIMRVDKLLANLGYCTRSAAPDYLKQHRVCLQERRITTVSDRVPATDICIDGTPPDHPEGIAVVLNKPAGYICTHDSSEGRRVYDLLPQQWMSRNPVLSSVGRLDKDTTGVLLITDNTAFNHAYSSSKKHVEKVYQVTLDRPLSPELAALFASGTLLLAGEKKPCLPALLRSTGELTADVVLTEGKYHQVKRMFGMFGYTVLKLHRLRFGIFSVENVPEGTYKEVSITPPQDGVQSIFIG